MALIGCSECGAEISNKAVACPKCGNPIAAMNDLAFNKPKRKLGPGAFIVCSVVGIWAFVTWINHESAPMPPAQSATPIPSQPVVQAPTPGPPIEKTAISPDDPKCKTDLACWSERSFSEASSRCRTPVEKLSQYSFRWTDRFLEQKFSRYRWLEKPKGTVTYIGDRIEFQTETGAYQPQIYSCDFDPSKSAVLTVRAFPGRL